MVTMSPIVPLPATLESQLRKRPEWIVAASAALWGLFWIPLRAFDRFGLEGAWTTLAQFVVPLILLAPFIWLRRLRGKP
ncbi:MAG: hypothetical protein AAF420_05740, partial [Pseudomonadota bacterium]